MKTRLLLLTLLLAAANAGAQFCPLGETHRKIVICRPDATMDECRTMALKIGCSIHRLLPLIHAVVVEVPNTRMSALKSLPRVSSIAEDKKVHWLQTLPQEFSASGFSDTVAGMRALQNSAAAAASAPPAVDPRVPWGVARVGAPDEWSRSQGDGAAVGVIDTGIDATHSDLQGQVVGGVNIVDPAHPNNWADDEGHGTHVSGTIAANGQGLLGVAPKAKLYAIKVLDAQGNGDYSSVIAGIQWAMDHNIKIVNMSLGADEGSDALHLAVQAALKAGVTIIAASGNTGGAVGYPGAYPEVIAVGASDSANHVAGFSSRGPQVSFIAPGVNIRSAKMGGGYVEMSGTSMATPHIAGLAALAWSLGAHDPQSLRAALTRAARPLDGLTPDLEGSGLVLAGNLGPSATAGQAVLASLQ
jgi:subtilisin